MTGRNDLQRDLVVVACAVSAGIHAALTPAHFAEGTGPGGGFLAAATVLAALTIALTRRAGTPELALTAAVLGGLLASYALAVTSGIPVVHPDPESIDGLAVATKLVEAAGLVAALDLLTRGRSAATVPLTPKGAQT
jgi:hypothetical protein